jgi:hypothetical protein
LAPDEAALASDLTSERFEIGVDRGWWALRDRSGTTATFHVVAETGRSVDLILDCAGYPGFAPAGALWSIPDASPLQTSLWPQGGRASEVFSLAWSVGNGGSPYIPYDRRALMGHDVWRTDHPRHVWGADKSVVDYLLLIRDVLRPANQPAVVEVAA